jgi:hypothetical protein
LKKLIKNINEKDLKNINQKMKIQEFYGESESKNQEMVMGSPEIRCVNMEMKEEGMLLPRYSDQLRTKVHLARDAQQIHT